jgi:hypothetical protein
MITIGAPLNMNHQPSSISTHYHHAPKTNKYVHIKKTHKTSKSLESLKTLTNYVQNIWEFFALHFIFELCI